MQDQDIFYIDLGRYVETLFRQWQLILGSALVCALAAALFTYVQPKTYQARALVASTKVASSVSFDTAIETLSEEQLQSTLRMLDPQARRQSYVQLVKNPAIAQVILDELGDQLPVESRNIASLLRMVKGGVAENSDSIEILVSNEDPVLAANIANGWARAYVDHVNAVYAGGLVDESYNSIRTQTADAKAEYDQAQEDLESFLADNRASQYERQIAENETMILSMSNVYTMTASTIISNTMAAQVTAFSEQVGNLSTQLEDAYAKARQADGLLLDARNMRDQVVEGGAGAANSNALALMLLKSQVFATNEGTPNMIVQTTPASVTAEEMVADLDSLIAALEDRRSELEAQIQALSEQLLNLDGAAPGLSLAGNNPDTPDQGLATLQSLTQLRGLEGVVGLNLSETPMEQKVQELEQRVNLLNANLAREQDRGLELSRARDLAWETYKTLATKEAELKVAAQTRGSEVALAAPAAVPQNDTVSGIRNVALAAVVGLMLGLGAAYFIEFWWGYRGLQPEPITVVNVFRGMKLKPVSQGNTK